jgi:hypothetical protein
LPNVPPDRRSAQSRSGRGSVRPAHRHGSHCLTRRLSRRGGRDVDLWKP